MQKRDNEQSLGEAIRLFLEHNGLGEKLLETEIYQRWEELAGKEINLRTHQLRYERGVLRVWLKSAPLRQELQMRQEEWRLKINQRLRGEPVLRIELH